MNDEQFCTFMQMQMQMQDAQYRAIRAQTKLLAEFIGRFTAPAPPIDPQLADEINRMDKKADALAAELEKRLKPNPQT